MLQLISRLIEMLSGFNIESAIQQNMKEERRARKSDQGEKMVRKLSWGSIVVYL